MLESRNGNRFIGRRGPCILSEAQRKLVCREQKKEAAKKVCKINYKPIVSRHRLDVERGQKIMLEP